MMFHIYIIIIFTVKSIFISYLILIVTLCCIHYRYFGLRFIGKETQAEVITLSSQAQIDLK